MAFDTTDSKDTTPDTDVGRETSDTSDRSLSPTGQRAMQGGDTAALQEQKADDTADLQQRVEDLRAETEAREAARMGELDQQTAEREQMAENQATTAGTDASPDPPTDHHPQISTTERGNEVKVEGGAEMPERRLFSNIDEPSESEASSYREGRLR